MSFNVSRPVRLAAVFGVLAALALAFFALRGDGAKASPGALEREPAASPAKPTTPASRLPGPVARALGRHPVVVVSIYAPGSRVDELALAEARAGARAARVGFVAISAFHAHVGGLQRLFGVRSTPALLVLGRPGRLHAQLQGFADRDTVVQAAQ